MIKVKAGFGTGHYDLHLAGKIIGQVIKVERYYNIAPRGINVISWKLYLGGTKVEPSFSTRRDAVAYAETKQKES